MRIRWGAMGCLLCGLALATPAISQDGAGQARAEAGGPMHGAEGACPADCPMHGQGGCPACPMKEARDAGVTAVVEETERGALIRIEAPAGDEAARDAARRVAQRTALMLERGCPDGKGGHARGAGHSGSAPPVGWTTQPGALSLAFERMER